MEKIVNTLLILSLIFTVSCKFQKDTNSQKESLPLKHKDIFTDIEKVNKAIFHDLDKSKGFYLEVYKLTSIIDNCWVITISNKKSNYLDLRMSVVNNLSDSITETVNLKLSRSLKDEPYLLDSLDYYLENSDFWNLKSDLVCPDGADGTNYYIEGRNRNGKFNKVLRWTPQVCTFEKSNEFLKLIDYVYGLAYIEKSETKYDY